MNRLVIKKRIMLNGKEVKVLTANPKAKVSLNNLKPFILKMAKAKEKYA